MHHTVNRTAWTLAGTSALLAAACGGGGPEMRFIVQTPREAYVEQLRQAGLHTTALGRDWIAVAEQVLADPRVVDVPHHEVRYLDPARAVALAYRAPLERGQELAVNIDVAAAEPRDHRLFLDLFFAGDTAAPLQLVSSADSAGWNLDFVALRPGDYVLRVQPEALRGGRVTVTVSARGSLGFPVVGGDLGIMRSGFGASRDAGRREHHGVDLFAARGTPVVAAAAGRVTRVGSRGRGGNVVWMRDRYGRHLYYAHLDRQAVARGAHVQPGDTLGFVGNTGNARTTPPHLHFGIYMRGVGPVDPYYHLYQPPQSPPAFAGDPGQVGRLARVARAEAPVRETPHTSSTVVARLAKQTPVELLAGTGQWYYARLPSGDQGYIGHRHAEPLDPIDVAGIAYSSTLRAAPSPAGIEVDSLPGGAPVSVLGWHGEYVLVRNAGGSQGWIGAAALAPGGGGVAGAP